MEKKTNFCFLCWGGGVGGEVVSEVLFYKESKPTQFFIFLGGGEGGGGMEG